MRKTTKELIKFAQSLGFGWGINRSGHIVFNGHGRKITSSSTPSDVHAINQAKRNLTKIASGTFTPDLATDKKN